MSKVTVLTRVQQRMRWLALSCFFLFAACTPSYVAVSGTATITPGGADGERHALEYPIGDRNDRKGKIELWSDGAEREELDGKLQTLIHVGMVVHNDSNEPVRVEREQLKLDDVLLENGDVYRAPLATFDGEPEVPPGASGQYTATFRLPARVWPDDILAYHFTWAVRDSGGSHPQATNFHRSDYDRRVYVGIGLGYPWGYYPGYPWVYPSYRFGYAPPVYRYGYTRSRAYPPRVYARPRRR